MPTFSYRSTGLNFDSLIKAPADLSVFTTDFADGIPSNVTISSAAVTALGSTGASTTAVLVGTTTISGTQVTQITKTGGAGGTSPATNGDRFELTSIATLSNGEQLTFRAYIYIAQGATYAP